jgi:hypothetical protein
MGILSHILMGLLMSTFTTEDRIAAQLELEKLQSTNAQQKLLEANCESSATEYTHKMPRQTPAEK